MGEHGINLSGSW